jgi:alpha-mannosidase
MDAVLLPEVRDGVFLDADGNALPVQKVEGGTLVQAALPALGMTTVRFQPGGKAENASPFRVDLPGRKLETPQYLVEWNEAGALTRLYDRDNAREVLKPGDCANRLEIYEDRPLKYENWDVDIFYQEKCELAQLTSGPELKEDGALRLILRFRYAYRHSSFTQDVVFHADSRRIDFVTHASWHEDRRLLKAAFPVAVRATRATYDIQFGHAERPTHYNTSWDYARFEVVAHKWADLSEAGYGVAILNDCKYGHNILGDTLRITLLKSGKYPDTQADMGEHDFTYALLPHRNGPEAGGVIEEAVRLNLPVKALAGALVERARPVVSVDSPRAVIDAVKRSEEGDCLIVRLHECRGGRGPLKLTTGFPLRAFVPCNLLEENIAEPVEVESIQDELKPFEIKTYKLWWR